MEPGKDRGAVRPVSWRAPVDGCDHEGHPVGRKGCTTKRYCPFFAQSQQKPSPRCNFACSGALQEWPRKEERGDAAEWELAARGRLDGAELVWSDSSTPVGCRMANTCQGWRTGATSYDPFQPEVRIPFRVIKGGSHLCAPVYCRRYRPHAEPADTSPEPCQFPMHPARSPCCITHRSVNLMAAGMGRFESWRSLRAP